MLSLKFKDYNAKHVDPYKMAHYEPSQLNLHCLLVYLFVPFSFVFFFKFRNCSVLRIKNKKKMLFKMKKMPYLDLDILNNLSEFQKCMSVCGRITRGGGAMA